MHRAAVKRIDYLDLEANQLVSDSFQDVVRDAPDLPVDLFASPDPTRPRGTPAHRLLTFDKLLASTGFVDDLREILTLLETAYSHPVDIEFTANFTDASQYRINLLQCRPLHVRGSETIELPQVDVAEADRLVEARGAVVGQSLVSHIDRFIYVVPERYGRLPVHTRHEISRLLSDINRAGRNEKSRCIMAIGPGRWGTSSPELGIPVSFSDINTVSILCEVVCMHDNLVPDVSLGTHFLNELVEMNMLYLALFPDRGQNYMNTAFFEQAPNRLPDIVPSAAKWADTVRVIDATDVADRGRIRLIADAQNQKVVCYFTGTGL